MKNSTQLPLQNRSPNVVLEPTRFERKFLVEDISKFYVESVLLRNPATFRDIYPPRYVNNIYFDTLDLRYYLQNLKGASQKRTKVRIRWYGDLLGKIKKPTLEFKIREGEVNRKLSFPIPSFTLKNSSAPMESLKHLSKVELPKPLELELKALRPTLLNRYYRRYLLSACGTIRATIDTELEYRSIHGVATTWAHRVQARRCTIVELKYANDDSIRPERVSNFFPFRLTRSSKYVMGIQATLAIPRD